MQFVIFHGALGSIKENWFPDLKAKLESMGQEVFLPQFPVDDPSKIKKDNSNTIQNLDSWTSFFKKNILPKLKFNEKVCFVGHSLGNLFILHLLEKFDINLDCAIFVSPTLDGIKSFDGDWLFNKINSTFYKTDFDYDKLKSQIDASYVLYSDTDPYIEPYRAKHFASVLDSSHILVRQAGHLNSEVNMNEFPLVFDLCMSRIDLSLYQKYQRQMNISGEVARLKDGNSKVVKLTPEETLEEGVFHFMNLRKGGFATFLSNAENWDPEDSYFSNGRKLAKSGANITRVFIIKDAKDLKREVLRKHIELDILGGINVYAISYDKFKDLGTAEDFGVWDNEYVCTLIRDKSGKIEYGTIDAQVKSILTAQNWRDKILRASKKIEDMKELDDMY